MNIGQRELLYVAEAFIVMFDDQAADKALEHASACEQDGDSGGRDFWQAVASTIRDVTEAGEPA